MTQLLFSTDEHSALDAQLHRLGDLAPLAPFGAETRAFVADFSRRIFALPVLRQHPELATLAHWFRAAAHDSLAQRTCRDDNQALLARGLVFHLAPANVDVLFAYAWLISVLSGNRNVARLSQKPSAQREALVSILQAMQREGLHRSVLERSVLLTYPHDDSITSLISRHCHARIIWGGDATVAKIRSLPLAPLAVEMAFPDRFGVAAFNSTAFESMQEAELCELARRFNNDVLWFGQQACSSPRTLYWVGDAPSIARARSSFWPHVHALSGQIEDEPAALMARVTDAHLMAALGYGVRADDALGNYPLTLQATHSDDRVREMQSGHGLLVEVEVPELASLPAMLGDRDQTLVQYGFARDDLLRLLSLIGNRALDRIVPVGRALDFHPVWDGTDLRDILTRKVTLPGADR